MIVPGSFDLQDETLSCNKLPDGKFGCKKSNIKTGEDIDIGIMDNIIFTGSIPNMVSIVGGDKADFFVQGDAKCTIITDTIYCSPLSME